jgi:hypothetical protein
LPQRAAFYAWLHQNQHQNQTKWCDVAQKTVLQLQVLLRTSVRLSGFSNAEIQKFVRIGNQIILEDVWQDLQQLHVEPIQNPYIFDALLLHREQVLIQSYYEKLSPKNTKKLEKGIKNEILIAKIITKNDGIIFFGKLLDINQRWAYGMQKMGYNVIASDAP